MRLFIGVDLPEDLKNRAAAAASRLRERIARVAPEARVRWVMPSNLHVTVWFLGEVREPRIEALIDALKKPLAARSFILEVAGAGAFPPSGPPRGIWFGLEAGRDGLAAIHDELRLRLIPLGFEPEKRPYAPHVTIARIKTKDVRPAEAASMRRALRDATGDLGTCEVRSATLFASRATQTGSQYEALLQLPLAP
jgi:RNA 2',3'-cyclic 3'-phosphodiesterase